jgi:hypothetical protein
MMLNLERCSFLLPLLWTSADGDPGGPAACWATGQASEVSDTEQAARCLVAAHASCPMLLRALAAEPNTTWAQAGAAARVVAEACELAAARLEVQAERLTPGLAGIFGPAE